MNFAAIQSAGDAVQRVAEARLQRAAELQAGGPRRHQHEGGVGGGGQVAREFDKAGAKAVEIGGTKQACAPGRNHRGEGGAMAVARSARAR